MTDEGLLNEKDITDIVISDEQEQVEEAKEEKPKEQILEGDHPAIAIIDIALNQAQEYCKKNNIPEPNLAVYQSFSRSFLNKALWHYFPSGDLPDDPRIALILGISGLGFACLPTVLYFFRKNKDKTEVKDQQKQEQKTEQEQTQEIKEAKLSPVLEKVKARMQA
ncbi:MAG: hypothetical protein QFX36_04045 [Archaeoglobales archaeon]|nr:hypothetical protein [Archaeoglobales archaeon]